MKRCQQGVETVGNKICILEKDEQGNIEQHPADEDGPGGNMALIGSKQVTAEEVDGDGGDEDQEVDALSPGIEEQTGAEQKEVPQEPGGCSAAARGPVRSRCSRPTLMPSLMTRAPQRRCAGRQSAAPTAHRRARSIAESGGLDLHQTHFRGS